MVLANLVPDGNSVPFLPFFFFPLKGGSNLETLINPIFLSRRALFS